MPIFISVLKNGRLFQKVLAKVLRACDICIKMLKNVEQSRCTRSNYVLNLPLLWHVIVGIRDWEWIFASSKSFQNDAFFPFVHLWFCAFAFFSALATAKT